MEKWQENFPALFPYIISQKISMSQMLHDKFKYLFSCFLDVLNIFKAKKITLKIMMCHPLPDSYTEWYLISQNLWEGISLKSSFYTQLVFVIKLNVEAG